MNSKNLKKTYSQQYENFFLQHSCVLSTPFVMSWSGDILNNYSGVGIKQKIPLRLYAGYNKTNSGTISINTIYHLDINEFKFIETNAEEYAPYFSEINKTLQKKYSYLVDLYGGIEINILSELPRGVGLGFGSILALLLSATLQKIDDRIDSKHILELRNQNINNLLNDTYSPFYQLFLDALELDKCIYGMISSGTKLASFFDTYYPLISFSQDFDKSSPHVDLSTNKYFGFRLNDLFPSIREVPYSPIDYGIIYSGKPVLLEQIAGSHYNNNKQIAKEIKNEFSSLFGDYLDQLQPEKRPRFYKHLVHSQGDDFDLIYGKLLGIISLKILYFMSKIYGNGYDESNMLQLIDAVKKLREADSVTRDSSATFLKFIKTLMEGFTGSAKHFALAPNDSTIMGGSLLFALPLEGFRTNLIESIQKTSQEFTGTKMIYANWVDGVENQGLLIEQDLKNGIYSEFISSNNCILKRVDGKIALSSCDVENINHQGLLLDAVNNKMYLQGKKLTSQELHSQTATIEILKYLIEHLGQDISNKNLPLSSYSKNKNDMLGKIILPLIELVEKTLNKRVPLICKGSLYDFYLKLNPSDIEIAVLDDIKFS